MFLDREQINNLIPQSPPFLLLNQVTDFTDQSLIGEYMFSSDEEFLKGHFPGDPIIPGVLMCECCLQAGAVLMSLKNKGQIKGKAIVTKMDKVKFKNFLLPNQLMTIQVNIIETIEQYILMKGKISHKENVIMTMEFMVGVTN